MTSFVERFNKILKEKKITQSELSKMTGITQSSISDWVRGKYIPRQDKVYVLSKALKVSPAYLLGYDDVDNKKIEITSLSKEEKDLLNNYNNSSTQGKKIILDTSKNISKAYPYISREEMIDYLEEFQIAAYNGAKNLHSLSYEELEEKYYRLKEDFGDDK